MEDNTPKVSGKQKPGKQPQRFLPNNQYFTISIYTLIVLTIGTLIIRVIMTPHAVTDGISRILNVLMPFIIGTLIALILNPIIKWMVRFLSDKCRIKNIRVCKAASTIVAYLCVLGIIMICILFIVPQIIKSVTEVINSLPQLYSLTYEFFNNLQERMPNTDVSMFQKIVNDTLPDIISYIKNFASDLVPAIYSASVYILKWVLNIVIAIIVSAYMLTDKKNLLHSMKLVLYSFVPVKYISPTVKVLRECYNIFTRFIVGKAIDSTIIGVLCFVLMNIFQMEYALLISVIVGITNMIPYFGPFIGAVPGILVLLMVSPLKALGFGVLILVLQQFDGLYLGPKIMGDTVGLKPLWIIIAITLGGSIGGVLGMFLSVPLVAILGYLLGLLLDYRLKTRNFKAEEL